jgi:hypothetical protein
MEELVKNLNLCRDKQIGEEGKAGDQINGQASDDASTPATALIEETPCLEHRRALDSFIELSAPTTTAAAPTTAAAAESAPPAGAGHDHAGIAADITLMQARITKAKAEASRKKDACDGKAMTTHEITMAGHEQTRSRLVGEANSKYSRAAEIVNIAYAASMATVLALEQGASRVFGNATTALGVARSHALEANATLAASLSSQVEGAVEARALQNSTVTSAAEAMETSHLQTSQILDQSKIDATNALHVSARQEIWRLNKRTLRRVHQMRDPSDLTLRFTMYI